MPAMLSLPSTPLVIRKGRTFEKVVRWETEPFKFAVIQSISNGAPVAVTTSGPHGIPNGWRVAVVDALGLTELNAEHNPPGEKDFRRATVVDTDRIEINPLSAASFGRHRGGTGFLQWYTPHDLGGYVARMSVKNKVGGAVLLTSLDGGIGIELDDAIKTITLRIDAAVAETLAWKAGVYDLELESPDGDVTVILAGPITAEQEVTTPIL